MVSFVTPSTQPLAWEASPTAPLRVLIVEDSSDTALSCQLLLQLHGLEVQTVPNGLQALEVVPTFRPDVVLLDIGLPGLDGWEVARQVRTSPTAKPPFLIALTGSGQPEDRRRSQEAGIDLHVLKPADPVWLARLLERFQHVVR